MTPIESCYALLGRGTLTFHDLFEVSKMWVSLVAIPLAGIAVAMLIQWARVTKRWREDHFPWCPKNCMRDHTEELRNPKNCPICGKSVGNLEIHALRKKDVGHAVLLVHMS